MARKIVICIDGTNNYPAGGYTNVQRLFRLLERDDDQLTYYQPGAGTIEPGSTTLTLTKHVARTVDAVSAWMMEQHVCAAYRYLMAEHQDGDELSFFGFSRGAFSARVLAGMLTKVGLLHRGLDSMVSYAWKTYVNPTNHLAADDFRSAYSRSISNIHFLGLFDTVSAVGLPWEPKVFPLSFHNSAVLRVRHAQSLDERRVMFVPNRWFEPGPNDPPCPTEVLQVWFAGVHSDVGGGYPEAEAGLSRITLAWMLREMKATPLRIDEKQRSLVLDPSSKNPAPDVESVSQTFSGAPQHDEMTAKILWRAAELLPIPRMRYDDMQGKWVRKWIIHRSEPRHPPGVALVHESVQMRSKGGYRPTATLRDVEYIW